MNKLLWLQSRSLHFGVYDIQVNALVHEYMRDTIYGGSCEMDTWTKH